MAYFIKTTGTDTLDLDTFPDLGNGFFSRSQMLKSTALPALQQKSSQPIVFDAGAGKNSSTQAEGPLFATITGTAGNDVLVGTSASDTINALGGHDIIQYTQTTTNGSNVDTIDGGAGTDLFEITLLVTSSRTVDLTAGIFRLGDLADTGSTRGFLTNIENVTVSGGVDIRGDAGNNVLTATDAVFSNTIEGMGGNDTINAGGGADVVDGGDGNDTITDGEAAVLGGDGADSYDGGAGIDTLIYTTTFTNQVTINLATGFQTLGVSNRDSITNIENVTITGSGSLVGDANNNILRALGNFDNTIEGGLGVDSLYGGDGDDTFVYDTATGTEFFGNVYGEAGTDRILLRGDGIIDLDHSGMDFNYIEEIEFDVDGETGERTVLLGEQELDSGFGSEISPTTLIDGRGAGLLDHVVVDSVNSGSSQVIDLSGWTFSDWDETEDTITILGTTGNDTITGSIQGDIINSGDGDDTILSGDGVDTVYAGTGDDEIIISNVTGLFDAGDFFDGEDGNDTITSIGIQFGSGAIFDLGVGTYLSGFAGFANFENYDGTANHALSNEHIIGTAGVNIISMGAGDNTVAGLGGADILDGGAGTDRLDYSASGSAVQINLEANTAAGGDAAGDIFSNFESVEGSDFDDTLTSSFSFGVLNGNAGNDIINITGGLSGSTLNGGAGDDILTSAQTMDGSILNGGSGNDELYLSTDSALFAADSGDGGAGDDLIGLIDEVFNQDVDGGANEDTLTLAALSGGYTVNMIAGTVEDGVAGDMATFTNIENIIGSDGADTITGDGSSNVIDGGTGADTINGGGGNDTLNGESGEDIINGGTGNDVISGGFHVDTIDAGDGDDTILFEVGHYWDHVNGGAGTDTLDASGNVATGGVFDFAAGTITGYSGGVVLSVSNVEIFIGGATDDTIISDGSGEFYGGGGNDYITAGLGADETLDGGDGIDTLDTTTFNGVYEVNLATGVTNYAPESFVNFENIITGNGTDTIVGTAGDNEITTNGGDDVINAGEGEDTVDAGAGADLITDTGTDVDFYDGGADIDTLEYTLLWVSGTIFNLSTGEQTVLGNVRDTFSNIENLTVSGFAEIVGDGNDNVLTAIGNYANVIDGGDGADTINAGGGDDTINGGGGGDTINGGDGNDTIQSGTSADTVDAGAGDDNVIGNALMGDLDYLEVYDGGAGVDTFTVVNYNFSGATFDLSSGMYSDGISTFTMQNFENYDGTGNLGTTGVAGEIVRGTSGANIISTGDGDNRIEGRAGDDTISGGTGNDSIEGGAGADVLDGGADTDTVDYASSLAGVTVNLLTNVNTGGDAQGDDLSNFENIFGSLNNDILTGDAGANFISATDGNDRLDGGDGDDVLFGDNGADTILGGAGADLNDGGLGFDAMDYRAASSRVVFDLGAGGTLGDALGDSYVSIERAYGSDFNDTITGTAANEFFYGEDGNDTINGGGGIDRIYGGEGNDIQRGQDGNDTLYGSAGNDQLNGGTGFDVANYSNASSFVSLNMASGGTFGDAAGDTYFGIEAVYGSDFNDILIGNTSSNELRGGDGDDIVNGGAGNDRLYGGAGADAMNGGTGTDTAYYTTASAGVTLDMATGGTGGEANGDTFSSVEWVRGSDFNDDITGSSVANSLFGNDGNDTLSGAGGNDRLYGGEGDDTINGGDGIDFIYGQAGNDTLFGNADNDFFYASAGGDAFDGGSDFDTVSYVPSAGGVTVNMQTGGTGGDANGDTYVSIERVFGSTNDDIIIGSNGDETIVGNGGADIIGGGQGNDRLFGGAGDDAFVYDTTNGDADLIYNFRAGTLGDELIYIEGGDTDFDTFAEVMAVATQVGNNVVFDFGGGNTMTFINLLITRFEAIDFDFGGSPAAEAPSAPKLVEAEMPASLDDKTVSLLEDLAESADVDLSTNVDASDFAVAQDDSGIFDYYSG